MNRKHYLILSTLILPALLPSCLNNKDESAFYLSERKMTQFLIDLHTADAIMHTEQNTPPEKYDMGRYYYPSLLEKYGITRAQADSSVSWYSRHPKQFARIYEDVVRELEKRQIKDVPTVKEE
jgi:hypothetical protein